MAGSGPPARVEQSLVGRELSEGLLGQKRPKRLPPREVLFGQPPQHPVYGFADRPITCPGVLRSLNVVPSPNWPRRLSPQVQTVPSPLTAMLWP